MFGISFEHIVILGVILLIMGPKKLPQLGNSLGLAIKNFKDAFSGKEQLPPPPSSNDEDKKA